ncbi:hypothetical protein DSECCO2_541880 [anaerobic digester metagenome]
MMKIQEQGLQGFHYLSTHLSAADKIGRFPRGRDLACQHQFIIYGGVQLCQIVSDGATLRGDEAAFQIDGLCGIVGFQSIGTVTQDERYGTHENGFSRACFPCDYREPGAKLQTQFRHQDIVFDVDFG